MASLPSQKCKHCRKAFIGRIDQLYCGAKCRQAAYRARKAKATGKKKSGHTKPEKAALVCVCAHCGGSFWGKTQRAQFCGTSCRTLAHRAMKNALPAALGAVWGVPSEKALDLLETQDMGKIRELLECMGYVYRHEQRAWVSVAT